MLPLIIWYVQMDHIWVRPHVINTVRTWRSHQISGNVWTHHPGVILDGGFNKHSHSLSHSFAQRALLSWVAIAIPKPITAPNLSSLKIKKVMEENWPNHICPRACRFPRLTPHHIQNRKLTPTNLQHVSYFCRAPALSTYSGEDSIINQFTSCERLSAEDGNKQWQMEAVGKHFLRRHRQRHSISCSWQKEFHIIFSGAMIVWVMNWTWGRYRESIRSRIFYMSDM